MKLPLSKRPLLLLTAVVATAWLLHILALQGKKLAPDMFGGSAFQWSVAAIVAILIPVAILMSLPHLSAPGRSRRRTAFGLMNLALFLLIYQLCVHAIGGIMMARTRDALSSMSGQDAKAIAKMEKASRDMELPDRRRLAASVLYTEFGVTTAWRNEQDQLATYLPDERDQAKRREAAELSATLASTRSKLDWQIRQMPWLFGLNLGMFVFIVVGGLGYQVYFGPADAETEPAAGAPENAG